MLLKRHHQLPPDWKPKRNARGELLNAPPLDHVEVYHTGARAEQNFSTALVEAAIREGWMSIGGGKLVLDVKPERLIYAIRRGPGHYCCHCGTHLSDANQRVPGHEGNLTVGMQHVAEAHPNTPSPDPGNPAGYCRLNHYECVLDAEMHARFNFAKFVAARQSSGKAKSHLRLVSAGKGG